MPWNGHPNDPARHEYHEEEALRMVGKTVLAGITHRLHDGTITAMKQYAGVIEKVNREGFWLRLSDSEADEPLMWLPPAPRYYDDAPPGIYTMRSTGEPIENPDYLTTWFLDADPPETAL